MLDRNWNELLQELRVMQTGVQITTAFLMTLPFQSRFEELNSLQIRFYLVLLVFSVLLTGLIMTPVALDRGLFRLNVKEVTVKQGHRIVRVALVGDGAAGVRHRHLHRRRAAGRLRCPGHRRAVLLVIAVLLVVLPLILRRKAGYSEG